MPSKQQHQKSLITRLRRVEGQIRGIQTMISDDADCEAIAQQLRAARMALDRSFYEMTSRALQQQIETSTDLGAAQLRSDEILKMLAKYG